MLLFVSRRTHIKILKRIHAATDPGRGLLKRIDENRELLELLREKAPEFLEAHPWVVGWFEANDSVWQGLLEAFDSVGIADQMEGRVRNGRFPRPWPCVGLKYGEGAYKPQRRNLGNRSAQGQVDGSQDAPLVIHEIERAQKAE